MSPCSGPDDGLRTCEDFLAVVLRRAGERHRLCHALCRRVNGEKAQKHGPGRHAVKRKKEEEGEDK